MDEKSKTGLAGLLAQLFGYLDKPWKAFAVLALGGFGLIGWLVYDKRDQLFEAMLTPTLPTLLVADVPNALGKLAEETSADLIQIWSVDLASNSQTFVAARRHDGERPVIPSPRRLPIMDHASDIKRLVDILEGHPVCVDLEASGTPVARRLAERGMKRGCAIPIPPNPESFVGVIYLTWATPVDAQSESVASGAAREVAKKLATH